jgi:hypothetical protein
MGIENLGVSDQSATGEGVYVYMPNLSDENIHCVTKHPMLINNIITHEHIGVHLESCARDS